MLTSLVLSLFACSGGDATAKWSQTVDIGGEQDTDVGGFDPAATVSVSSYSPASKYDGNYWYEWEVENGLTVNWTANGLTVTEGGDVDVTGEGHFAVYVTEVDETSADPIAVTTDLSYTIDGSMLTHGDYWVIVAIVDNTGDLVQIYDIEELNIRRPSLELPRLADGMAVDSVNELTIDTSSFSLKADDIGGENAFTAGHYVVSLDGDVVGEAADDVFAWPSPLTAGAHTVSVELVENDGSSLSSPLTTTVDVLVPELSVEDATGGEPWNSASLPILPLVTDVTIDETAIGSDHDPGMGHYRLYVDDAYTASLGDADYALHVAAGMHTFEVRLANNDETETGISASWTATISEGRPDVNFTLPSEPITEGMGFSLSVSAENFTFDEANVGGAPVDGFGHYHVYVDDTYVNFGATEGFEVGGLAAGAHTVRVTLQENDHADLAPMVLDEQTITIEPAQVEDTGTGDTGTGDTGTGDTGTGDTGA